MKEYPNPVVGTFCEKCRSIMCMSNKVKPMNPKQENMETIFKWRKVNSENDLPGDDESYLITYTPSGLNLSLELISGNKQKISFLSKESNCFDVFWLEPIPIPKIIQEKDREMEQLKLAIKIVDNTNDTLQKTIQEKDTQIQELKEDVIGFPEWKESEGFTKICYLDNDDNGSWYDEFTEGINRHYFTTEQLYTKYKDSK